MRSLEVGLLFLTGVAFVLGAVPEFLNTDNTKTNLVNALQNMRENFPANVIIGTLICEDADGDQVKIRIDLGSTYVKVDYYGRVSLVQSLDSESFRVDKEENRRKIRFVCEETNTANKQYTFLETFLVLKDANDNTPFFNKEDNDNYYVVIPEDTPVGEMIYDEIHVVDLDGPDNNKIVPICIESECDTFEVRAKIRDGSGDYKFEIYTKKPVTEKRLYLLKISARDEPENKTIEPINVSNNTQNVVITILDVQNLPPEFEYRPLSFSLLENKQPDTKIGDKYVGAFDQDVGDPNYVRLELREDPEDTHDTFAKGLFSLRPAGSVGVENKVVWRADLMLAESIDRESIVDPAKTLKLTIMAIEYPPPGMENRTDRNPMTATETLEITILDVNDESPEFNADRYEIEFDERERIEDEYNFREISINYDIFVTDRDGKKFNIFDISIAAGNDDNAFILNRYEGAGQQDITVLARDGILDYDNPNNLKERTIVLRAEDRDNPSLFSEAVFVLQLIDLNDNQPVFPQGSLYTFSINEQFYTRPYFVGQVVADDADVGEFGFITGYSFSGNFSSKFSINDNGEIYVSGDINYEAEQSYIMTVSAVDSGVGPNRQTGEATVLVIVNNIPDIGPRFTSDRYVTFVTEQTTDLVPEVRVLAEDPEGVSAVRYSVNSTIPPLPVGYFIFPDPFSGLMILTQGIDYQQTITQEQKGTIRVLVQACTQAQSTQLCTLTNVIVTVRDQNNFAPEFRPGNYYEKRLSELAKPGEVVLQVSTYDRDIETDPLSNNAKVRYQIARGNRDDFHIRINSGEIIVSNNANLDVDTYDRYEILVIARDFGDPGKSSNATVVIILEDANNKDPEFTETTYFLNVFENATIGTAIPPAVRATDPDRDAIIKYELDFSNLIVELEGSRTAQPDYILAAQEALAINPDTGMIQTATLLDRTQYEVINFDVIARDVNIDETTQQQQTATASVMIFILGIAETNPYFIAQGKKKYDSNIRISRPESGQIDWALYYLYAFDPVLSQAVKRYEIIEGTDPNEYFELDGRIVRVKQVIDYDTLDDPRQLSVGVRAITDDGNRFVDAMLLIDITDVNDNSPKFVIRSYQFYVSESSTYGKAVGSVYATDIDSGTYGEIEYFIEGVRSEDFIIRKRSDERMATIYVSREAKLDFETWPRYTLTVIAIDNPGPDKLSNERLRGNADLEIIIEDENDNNPIFEQDMYEFEVVGTKPVFEEIDVVLANDLDKGRNGDILYSASDSTSSNATFYFGVDTQYRGSLTMGRIFVRNSLRSLSDNSVFKLTVVATDNGISEVRTGTALVQITVSKGVRDPKPKWDPGLKSKVTVLESRKAGYSVAYITARPANATSRVQYNFITRGDTEGDFSKFSIDPNTGHVTLAAELDYETKPTYNLLIQASDVGNLSLTNQFLLTVLVEDVDDNLPAFTACPGVVYPIPVTASIFEDAPLPTYVYTARACDLDSLRYNRVRYSFHYDDRADYGDKTYCRQEETDPFTLDEDTGDIYATAQLDREVKDSHLLCVSVEPYYPVGRRKRDMAEDLRNRTNHDTVLYVLVTVLDANDKGPKFVLDTDYKVILESPPVRSSITVAKAYDDDLYPNNEIRYTIDRILFTKGGKSYQAPTAFNINTKDGSLTIGAYDRSFSDYVGGYFTIDVRAADARGEFPEEDTMTITVYVGHSSEQIRVVFNRRADSEVEEEARQMVAELNGLKEAGLFYEIMSFGPHQISNVEDPDFERTDVCLMIIKDNRAMSSLDAVKRLSDVKAVRDVLNKYGAVEPGPCEPARSVYPEGWESYWWVLVAFAIFIFVITIILIIIVVFLHRSYKNYMDSHKTYLVSEN